MASAEAFRNRAAAAAEALFNDFLAPLVVGGPARPGRPLGTRLALALGPYPGTQDPRLVVERRLGDIDLVAHVELARVRIARKLAPVDRFGPATWPEWAIGAALHDLVQATHPGWRGAFRLQSGIGKILRLVDATLAEVPAPATMGEVLSRHTWFARMFELSRVDTTVSWWTGHALFRGEAPPRRLTAWPELRSVTVTRTPHPLMELAEPALGSAVPTVPFADAVTNLLRATPLTDLATIARASPEFRWSSATLSLVGSPVGRALGLRALATQPADAVDGALGAATRALLKERRWNVAAIALEVLRERALASAEGALVGGAAALETTTSSEDVRFARGAGAKMADAWLVQNAERFRHDEQQRLRRLLAPAAGSMGAKELDALLAHTSDAPALPR